MRPYFEKMDDFGRELKKKQLEMSEENVQLVKAEEAKFDEAVEGVKNSGFPAEKNELPRGKLRGIKRRKSLF